MLKKKLSSKGGFTMAELLVSMAIMALVGLAVAVGISTAGRAYTEITMSSEASVLCATLSVEIADELRFARDIDTVSGVVTYTSPRFGTDVSVNSADGRISIGTNPILSEGAYTNLNAEAGVTYNGNFMVTIEITNAGGKVLESSSFSVSPISG